MDELLTEDQTQLRDSAAKLCRDLGGAKRARAIRDGGEIFDRAAWREIVSAGWLGAPVPETRGGLGLGMAALYLVIEQIGRHLVTAPLVEAAASAWLLGKVEGATANAALAALLAGEHLILPALPGEGWDFRTAPLCAARSDGKNLIVNGTIAGVAFAPAADEFLIAVAAQNETLLCLLRRNLPGCSLSSEAQVDGTVSGTLLLADVALDQAAILARGEEAKALLAQTGDLLALGTAIALLGLAESVLAMTQEHVKTRKQFGHPLGSFQALQHRLVDGFVDLELDRSLLHRICLAWDEGASLPAMIAAAKARASRSAAEIARTGLQLHGAIGYTDEHDVGMFFKRALVLAAGYGNEYVQSERFAHLMAEEA